MSVLERIDNDHLNNMLIESWYMNSIKLAIVKEYYHQLDDLLCAVDITDVAIYDHATPITDFRVVVSTVGADTMVEEIGGAGLDDFASSFEEDEEENQPKATGSAPPSGDTAPSSGLASPSLDE